MGYNPSYKWDNHQVVPSLSQLRWCFRHQKHSHLGRLPDARASTQQEFPVMRWRSAVSHMVWDFAARKPQNCDDPWSAWSSTMPIGKFDSKHCGLFSNKQPMIEALNYHRHPKRISHCLQLFPPCSTKIEDPTRIQRLTLPERGTSCWQLATTDVNGAKKGTQRQESLWGCRNKGPGQKWSALREKLGELKPWFVHVYTIKYTYI